MFPSPNWMMAFYQLGIQGVSKKVPFRINNDPKPESSEMCFFLETPVYIGIM